MKPFALAAALAALLPLPCLAQTSFGTSTGPYQVGTIRVSLVDSTRTELSRVGTAEPRRLITQIWYPAAPARETPLAAYVPEFDDLAEDLSEAFPELQLESLMTRAFWNAAPVSGRRFPLVVFSHGMNSARYFYTGLVQELASYGFVVAAVDHPFWAIAAAYPDGRRLSYSDGMASRDQLTSDQIDSLMQDGVRAMAADQAFVASGLSAAAPRLSKIIDGTRTGVMGHSMGGMAATQACWTYGVFQACVSLDGLVWVKEGLAPIGEPPNRVAKPFLLLMASQFLPQDEATFSSRYRRVWQEPSLCLVTGSRHNSFTDLPQLRGTSPGEGELETSVAADVVKRAIVGFFRSTLVGPQPSAPPAVDPLIRSLGSDAANGCRMGGSGNAL